MNKTQPNIQCDIKNCEHKATRKITYKPLSGEPEEVRIVCDDCFERTDRYGTKYYKKNILRIEPISEKTQEKIDKRCSAENCTNHSIVDIVLSYGGYKMLIPSCDYHSDKLLEMDDYGFSIDY